MKVTIKGQVTIPAELREKFRLEPGTQVEFVEEIAGRLEIRRAAGRDQVVADWLQDATGAGNQNLTSDEIMAATRGED